MVIIYGTVEYTVNKAAYSSHRSCLLYTSEQEVSSRKLVYTESGFKPKNLIDDYWEKFNFVHVDRLAWGWYDIYGI